MWHSPVGVAIAKREQSALAPMLRRVHGEAALWIGSQGEMVQSMESCMVRRVVFASPTSNITASDQAGAVPELKVSLGQLPFPSGSLDGIILHHALEASDDPRGAVREAARVLAPGGRLVICGFNPVSLYGLRRLYAKVFPDALTAQQLVNPIRLLDWLALLDLTLTEEPLYLEYGLPFALNADFAQRVRARLSRIRFARALGQLAGGHLTQMIRQSIQRLPLGGVVVMSALKQQNSMIFDNLKAPQRRRRLQPVSYPRTHWRDETAND